jgi:hypothetical protein
VETILYVPIAELLRPDVHHTQQREAYGMMHEVHFFQLPSLVVWGATARVLDQLLSVWRSG